MKDSDQFDSGVFKKNSLSMPEYLRTVCFMKGKFGRVLNILTFCIVQNECVLNAGYDKDYFNF